MINKLKCFVNEKKPDLVSLTKFCIFDSKVCEHHLLIPGYILILKNRTCGVHGGVGLHINNSIKFKALTDLYHRNHELLRACLKTN